MSVPLRWQEPVEFQEPIAAPTLSPRPRARRRAKPLRTLAMMSALCLAMSACTALGVRIGSANTASSSTLRLVSTPSANGRVLLANANVERRLGFVTVTGSVFNRSRQKLSNVEAVVELLDSHNRTVQVESALIAFDPLPAGQAAPFKVEMPDNTNAVAFRTAVRTMFGSSLD